MAMTFGKYVSVQNAVWTCLVDNKISELPINIKRIAGRNNIKIIKNSLCNLLESGESGAAFERSGTWYVIYNDAEPRARCRFTVAHEFGHIFLGHLATCDTDYRRNRAAKADEEKEADVFAARLLMPSCVLHELGITEADKIAEICRVSHEAAYYRSLRMGVLEKNNKWYSYPLERMVADNFREYIIAHRC